MRKLSGGAGKHQVNAALGKLVHVGPLGMGAAAKLVAKSALFGTLGMLSETLALARGLGLADDAAWMTIA